MKVSAVIAALVLLIVPTTVFAQDTYLGDPATNCSGCHGPTVTTWLATGHGSAFDAISFLGYSCLPCHTTGWDETVTNFGADEFVVEDAGNAFTITDQTNFDLVKNVQCETCHGPVGDAARQFPGFAPHLAAPPVTDLAADNCGACHQGSHHPTFPEWQASLHAVAKETSLPGFGFISLNRGCAGCHTAEGFLQWVEQTGLEPDVDPPGPAGNDLTCAACHDPHGNANAGNLRLPKVEICQKCHNPEYNPDNPVPMPGQSLHHSTAYMFEGTGGFEFDGYLYPTSPHKFTVTDKCVACHVFMTPFVGEPEEIPAYTGHTFEPRGESCVPCHADFDPDLMSFDYRGIQTEIGDLTTQLGDLLASATPEDSLKEEFLAADFNYKFVLADGSHGIHNTDYARALLQSSITVFTTVPVVIEDFAAISSADGVMLSWNLGANWRTELLGVRVHRADQREGPYVDLDAGTLVSGDRMKYLDTNVEAGRDYWYRLVTMAADGAATSGPIQVTVGALELRTELFAPHIAQSGGPVLIRYNLARSSGSARLEIVDVRGRRLRVLDNAQRGAGKYVRTWDRLDEAGVAAPRGVYFVSLRVDNRVLSQKLVLLSH